MKNSIPDQKTVSRQREELNKLREKTASGIYGYRNRGLFHALGIRYVLPGDKNINKEDVCSKYAPELSSVAYELLVIYGGRRADPRLHQILQRAPLQYLRKSGDNKGIVQELLKQVDSGLQTPRERRLTKR